MLLLHISINLRLSAIVRNVVLNIVNLFILSGIIIGQSDHIRLMYIWVRLSCIGSAVPHAIIGPSHGLSVLAMLVQV